MRWGDVEGARRVLTRVQGLTRDTPGFVFRVDVIHLDGLIAWSERRPERAVELVEQAFAKDPTLIGVGADLAEIYVQLGRADDALAVIARSLEHFPGDERLLRLQAGVGG